MKKILAVLFVGLLPLVFLGATVPQGFFGNALTADFVWVDKGISVGNLKDAHDTGSDPFIQLYAHKPWTTANTADQSGYQSGIGIFETLETGLCNPGCYYEGFTLYTTFQMPANAIINGAVGLQLNLLPEGSQDGTVNGPLSELYIDTRGIGSVPNFVSKWGQSFYGISEPGDASTGGNVDSMKNKFAGRVIIGNDTDDSNAASDPKGGSLRLGGGVTFATLGTPNNGVLVYCTDCNATCSAGASGGKFCKREGGAWAAM